jgi:hypothetical protein
MKSRGAKPYEEGEKRILEGMIRDERFIHKDGNNKGKMNYDLVILTLSKLGFSRNRGSLKTEFYNLRRTNLP